MGWMKPWAESVHLNSWGKMDSLKENKFCAIYDKNCPNLFINGLVYSHESNDCRVK